MALLMMMMINYDDDDDNENAAIKAIGAGGRDPELWRSSGPVFSQ